MLEVNKHAANTYCSLGLCRCSGLWLFIPLLWSCNASAAHTHSSDMTACRAARAILWDLSSFNSSTAESVIFHACCRHVMFRVSGEGCRWVREVVSLASFRSHFWCTVLYVAKININAYSHTHIVQNRLRIKSKVFENHAF